MDLGNEIEKIIIKNLNKTIPAAIKEMKPSDLIDPSTAAMGFKKIKKNGIMVK
jgi:hypothetical protein